MCGYLTLNKDRPSDDQILARLAYAKGIRGKICALPPRRGRPLVTLATLTTSYSPPSHPLINCSSSRLMPSQLQMSA